MEWSITKSLWRWWPRSRCTRWTFLCLPRCCGRVSQRPPAAAAVVTSLSLSQGRLEQSLTCAVASRAAPKINPNQITFHLLKDLISINLRIKFITLIITVTIKIDPVIIIIINILYLSIAIIDTINTKNATVIIITDTLSLYNVILRLLLTTTNNTITIPIFLFYLYYYQLIIIKILPISTVCIISIIYVKS